MKLNHPALVELLQRAYSAEKAAAFAYIGHAASLKNPAAKAAVKQIENDEWGHRRNVLAIMQQYDIPISRFFEVKFHVIGRVISASCHVIGWFMPYFFAGKLESGNVCEYFVMMKYFHALDIREHDEILYEMGIKEKEHEVYFLEQIKDSKWLPYFEKVFSWGKHTAANDVDMANKLPVEISSQYCKTFKAEEVEEANRKAGNDNSPPQYDRGRLLSQVLLALIFLPGVLLILTLKYFDNDQSGNGEIFGNVFIALNVLCSFGASVGMARLYLMKGIQKIIAIIFFTAFLSCVSYFGSVALAYFMFAPKC